MTIAELWWEINRAARAFHAECERSLCRGDRIRRALGVQARWPK